jgi:hypothetical protein
MLTAGGGEARQDAAAHAAGGGAGGSEGPASSCAPQRLAPRQHRVRAC